MPKDLRSFLQELEARHPEEMVHIDREIGSKWEVTALQVKLEKQGNDVELIRFEDEGHGFVKRANRLVAYTSIANFLDKHLPAE